MPKSVTLGLYLFSSLDSNSKLTAFQAILLRFCIKATNVILKTILLNYVKEYLELKEDDIMQSGHALLKETFLVTFGRHNKGIRRST